jgi:Ni,Fe-hydrogenase I large subunit
MVRIVIDPITRAGGPLRVEAEISGGKVTAAWSSATMYRGMEVVLGGRDPRDAWLLAQRICGTCTGVHALASVRAVEQALGIEIPANARLIRNLLGGALLVRDHVMTLFQRGLPDWVDMAAAVTADPVATSRLARTMSAWPSSSPDDFRAVRDRLAATVGSSQPGPFAPAWPGHPAYRLSPEQSLLLVAHMLDALAWQRDFMRLHTLLSGKEAHPQTFLVGGMALAPTWGGPTVAATRQHPQVPDRNAPQALSDEGIALMRTIVRDARTFANQVVLPDTTLLLEAYPEWATIGAGPGNYLCAGEFPDEGGATPARLFPNGRLVGHNLARSEPVVATSVGESLVHAWYEDEAGDTGLRPPMDTRAAPAYTAQVPLAQLSDGARYSWVKAARLDGLVMETGPLARVQVATANGRTEVRNAFGRLLAETGLAPDGVAGALGRTLARAVEVDVVTTALATWLNGLESSLATGDLAVANIELWDPVSWPSEAEGASLGEGPRGSVGHWLKIRDAVIEHYQVVDGSTWNASPRDAAGVPGPMEAALAGVEVADPARPLEILRVIHSFAPCAACAAHAVDGPDAGREPGTSAPEGPR